MDELLHNDKVPTYIGTSVPINIKKKYNRD